MIKKLMEKYKLAHETLISHWEAYRNFANTGKETKLNAMKFETKDTISKLYRELRNQGIYPMKPSGGKMIFEHRESKHLPFNPEVKRSEKKDCKYGDCKACEVMVYQDEYNCEPRTKEWLKGIDTIMGKMPQAKGEGKKQAEEFIHYMDHGFMGGVK
jgi:hypothetical protein